MKKHLLLIVIVIANLPAIAQYYNYNYSQSYSSMNNVLARQQAETRARDQHYRNVYGNRSNSSSSSSNSYTWNRPVYKQPVKKTYTNTSISSNTYSSSSYNDWGESYAERQRREQRNREEAMQRQAAAERLEREREKERLRMEAEMERLRLEREAKLLQERLAYLKTRQPALKANPFQTIYTPPAFKDNTEKFKWYYEQAYNLSGITDPYACLVVSQMALDGEGTRPTTWIAREKNNNSPFSSLSLFIGGMTMLQVADKKDYDFILISLKAATDYTDVTNGLVRAYKTLLDLYRGNNLLGYAMRKDPGNEADVYAFAARNGDATALADLKKLIAANMDSVHTFSSKQLKSITQALPVQGANADYALWVWNKWGQKMQAAGDTACFAAYAKSIENPKAQAALIQTMQIRLLHLCYNDNRFAQRLTLPQREMVENNAKAYVQSFANYKQRNLRLKADDLGMLYKYYSGNCGIAPEPEKAVMVATDKLMDHKDFSDLQRAALAYRMGTGGWPKNDTRASQLFKLASQNIAENIPEEKKGKASYMATTADFWAADSETGLQKNDSEINYYLAEAARLDEAYSMEYADWCADKKSAYFSKEKALAHYNKALTWTEDLAQLFKKADVQDGITAKRIAEIKQKITLLK